MFSVPDGPLALDVIICIYNIYIQVPSISSNSRLPKRKKLYVTGDSLCSLERDTCWHSCPKKKKKENAMLITTLKEDQDINRIYEGQKKKIIRKEIAMSFVVVNERGSSEGRTRDQLG